VCRQVIKHVCVRVLRVAGGDNTRVNVKEIMRGLFLVPLPLTTRDIHNDEHV